MCQVSGVRCQVSCVTFHMSGVRMNEVNSRDRNSFFTYIVDPEYSDSRLPWLDIVLLCLDRVGLK